ncbi:peptide-N-glycosidase F-related protein [Chitinophagaceae bacterium LB-8]|uniref:Peptide-N-glycosidase F-related protein n=1 Tax=Paraflavisolibacter caeni TaxID=2982496 RepID=A0A9X2XNS6_9BACT|nr:peptide-N-glycosidase F-related protein [Paraflavisolibacter caeni]MCU7548999.1 peptide-N-glycosidase F-related protein [Paraflavisolibacter caeni]
MDHVITHNRVTIVTDPSKGENSYKQWGVFPKDSKKIRSVKMLLTLGSPDSIPTAHWDYCDNINIRRVKSKDSADKHIEIGRMLTPYGSIYRKGWQWQWEVDVTDFKSLLQDSVEIEYLHTGYEPVSVGWALTLDFAITYGPEIVKPMGMIPLWNDKYKYGDDKQPITASLLPVQYTVPQGAAINRIRIQHTGHGADQPRQCSEFCTRWRKIMIDQNVVDQRNLWKDCSVNPLYPQGGTWIYSRAYWCPGDLQQPDVIDVPIQAGKHEASVFMQPYTATGNIQAYEHIGSYLFFYAAPQQKYDAAIEEIWAPTNKQQYARLNPAIDQAKILVRNVGSNNLTSLQIEYGTVGFAKKRYIWKGNLTFNQTALVVLPGEIYARPGENKFSVTISKPNGKADAWTGDNSMTSSFMAPKQFPQQMIVQYKTNNNPQDNTILLINASGDTLFKKLPADVKPSTIYADTLQLKEGKYALILQDTAGDGLQFWANPRQGDGYLRLTDMNGNLVHIVESDCGKGETTFIDASAQYKLDTSKIVGAFSMYPRRTRDKIDLDVLLSKAAKLTVKITVDGILQQLHEYESVKQGIFTYSIASLPPGRYIVDVYANDERMFTGRVNKESR